ncbi:MAG: hypothetical protein KatS3mg108_2548 [Isosphaeraceae bacterium]|jgi:hypothetical protein|nr:MAG: hypothetical protein KatS3mg108_2548 [Isosphaeraceae bacterium]
MAKFRPGIPDNFSLNVEPVRDLGDYLDEPSPAPQRKPRQQNVGEGEGTAPVVDIPATVAPVAEQPRVPQAVFQAGGPAPVLERAMAPQPTPPQSPRTTAPVEPQPIVLREDRVIEQTAAALTVREPVVNEDQLPRPKGPRREISMTPETLRMSDELLDVIRGGSGQRDTKASELFHALVLLVHEAMDGIDTHAIPRRGRWGTPTARAYPLELKNAFLRALLRKYQGGASP